jgi:hypothetical protein
MLQISKWKKERCEPVYRRESRILCTSRRREFHFIRLVASGCGGRPKIISPREGVALVAHRQAKQCGVIDERERGEAIVTVKTVQHDLIVNRIHAHVISALTPIEILERRTDLDSVTIRRAMN